MGQMISIEEARRHYTQHDPAHDFDHVLRVLRLAERIGQAERADLEILRAAALLHDVARGEEGDHAEMAAERAREILTGHSPERVERVVEAIRSHRFRSGPAPTSLEARILYDADKLDAMGAIGVARAYAVAGQSGQRLWAPLAEIGDDVAQEVPAVHTPVHEFKMKLAKLAGTLHTRTAQQLAAQRHRYMREFFQRLEAEVRGEE
jgi:uncharacterized protein